ncbi:general secretion pathway protein GspB [Pontibacterium granulatum]|uniref:general secretion pathway protein GspB n=1 Tax=Pontibacterium granulatum TaxID=2036029 RepID=UPI00249B11D9|nr:general secretion pathway protein GspB [Pontibacterium granulatum]MDI3326620.1 general secretion pathway protein GspB [Pontibacterium granulatum]
MSYILDALKHSDRDRNRGKVPDIQTQTLQLVETSSGKPIPYMWAGVVFLAIAIVLVAGKSILDGTTNPVQTPFQAPQAEAIPSISYMPEKKVQVPLPIQATDPPLRNDEWLLSADALEEVENVRINTTQARQNDLSVASTRYADNLKQQAIVSTPKPTKPTPHISKPASPEPATVAFTKPKAVPKPQTPAEPDPYAGIPHQKQLPLQVQRALPELNFTVHIYSPKPASRLVKINGMRLREGDQISSALKLKQITKDGVILSYNNRPFWRTTR